MAKTIIEVEHVTIEETEAGAERGEYGIADISDSINEFNEERNLEMGFDSF